MEADLAYFKEFKKRTNGQVKVTKFNWAQSLLKVLDMLDGVGRGIADVTFFCPGYYPAKLPRLVGIPLMMGVANRYNEIVKRYIDPGIGVYFGCFLGMNLDVYKALPESVKQEVRKLRREWINVHLDELMKGEDEVLADIKRRGIRMLSFSPDQRAAWKTAVAPTDLEEAWIAEREKTGAPASEFMQKPKALVPKYEAMSWCVDPFNRIK